LSLATTIAQSQATLAAARWRSHGKTCNPCHQAAAQKRPAWRCPDGQQLATDARDTALAARREAELDKRPALGQGSLFGQGDLFADSADG